MFHRRFRSSAADMWASCAWCVGGKFKIYIFSKTISQHHVSWMWWFNQTANLLARYIKKNSQMWVKKICITRPCQTLCRPYRLTLDRTKNVSSSDGVQKHDQKQKDVREPLATPLGELWVDPHYRLFAHAQPTLREFVESLEMLRHKVTGTLRLNVLKELVAVEGKIRWMYTGRCGVWLNWYGNNRRWVSFVDEIWTRHDERDFGPSGAGHTEAAAGGWGGHFFWWNSLVESDDDIRCYS